LAALKRAMTSDAHTWVRETAARSLAGFKDLEARNTLLAAAQTGDARLRETAISALSSWAQEDEVQKVLRHAAEHDPSWICRRNALKTTASFDYVLQIAKVESNPWLLAGVASGMAASGDPRAIDSLIEFAGPAYELSNRQVAIEGLSKIGKDSLKVRLFLVGLLDDPEYAVVESGISAVQALGEKRAIDPLKRIARNCHCGKMRKSARLAAEELERSDQPMLEERDLGANTGDPTAAAFNFNPPAVATAEQPVRQTSAERIHGVRFGPHGELVYVITQKGRDRAVFGNKTSEPFDGIVHSTVYLGPQGRTVFEGIRDQKHYLVLDGKNVGPFEAITEPKTSEDGSLVVYSAARSNHRWLVGEGERLGEEYDYILGPNLSPDGKTVAYVGQEGNKSFAVIGDRRGPKFDMVSSITFSPDGKSVAYIAFEQQKCRVIHDGQSE
jgi:hypothetical protein